MFPDRIETARLILRPVTPADAPNLFASYASDPEVARFTTWRAHATVAETERFLRSCADTAASRCFALTLRSGAAPIGVFDLRRAVPTRLEYGCALGRRFWGQGLMTEAVRGAVDWFFTQPGSWRFGAVVDADNQASIRVMEKAGLQREGVLRSWLVHPNLGEAPRDCVSYAIVRRDDHGTA